MASLVLLTLSSLILLASPAVFISDMPLDTLIPLDGAWRAHHGQWPHLDFLTPVGSLYYALHWLAGAITGSSSVHLLIVVNVLAALPVAVMAVISTQGRLPEPLRSATVLLVTYCALSPRTLDATSLIGFNAMYNRWAWALSLVVACLVLLPRAADLSRPRRLAEQLTLLVAVLATAWLKMTFLPLLVLTVVIGCLVVHQNRRLAWGGLIGLCLTGLSMLTPLGMAYLGDLATAAEAAAGGGGLVRLDRVQPLVQANGIEIGLLLIGALALVRSSNTAEEKATSVVVLGASTFALGGLVIASQNNDATAPTLLIAMLVLVYRWRQLQAVRLMPLAAFVTFLLVLRPVVLDASMVVSHPFLAWTSSTSMTTFGPLKQIRTPSYAGRDEPLVQQVFDGEIPTRLFDSLSAGTWVDDNPIILDDAVGLLDEHDVRDQPIASLTFSPLFPYLLGTRPPRGLPAWWDYRRTFGESWNQRACAALADSTVVLEPKVWLNEGLIEQNIDCLESEFHRRGESDLWVLWVRSERNGGRK
ncbi:MAG: hypothetical protein EA397_20270 [Deltaproteobacteria bacterium]|nr:MAG: hypothetical protein EA397_20270 [Deltaproteobacteria bacterium]